jgi:hypothetical protein
MKSHEEIVRRKTERLHLDAHQRDVLRHYLRQGDKEYSRDYVYGWDEGEVLEGNIKGYGEVRKH